LEEHIAPIFRVEKYAEQDITMKTGGKQVFHAGILIGMFFDSEDGDDMFLRNVGWLQRIARRYIP
jgi:hypothetical protein